MQLCAWIRMRTQNYASRAWFLSKSTSIIIVAVFTILLCGLIELAAAGVTITPTMLTIGIPTGQTSAWGSITATNTGSTSVTITWSDSINCLQNLTPLTRTLAAGASTTFTIQGVCPATGSATLSGSGVTPVTFPVNITTAPAIGVNPPSLSYSATVGGATAAQTVAIMNAGGGTLTWSATDNVSWLTLSPPSGINKGTITATMNPAGLPLAGTYTATITLTAAGGVTRTIPVTLNLAPAGTGTSFNISPSSLGYTAAIGGQKATGTVTITNTGSTTLTVTWRDSIAWLVATSGDTVTIAPGKSATITHTASTAGLTAGSYSGMATIVGGGITKQVPITLTAVTTAVSTVNLAWNANTETDLAGYKIYLRTSSANYDGPIATLSKDTISYTVTGLQTGATYFFSVTAYDNSGNESPHSSELSKTIY